MNKQSTEETWRETIRPLLTDVLAQFTRRKAEMESVLADLQALKLWPDTTASGTGFSSGVKEMLYRRLQIRIRKIVENVVPPDACIAVVSKGDDELLNLVGRKALHFPATTNGQYAGYKPADSATAQSELENARRRGAQFILFPSTAFWWLDFYKEFAEHLRNRCRTVWSDENCAVFELVHPRGDQSLSL